MQLVDGNVRVLRTGPGGAKSDVIVDADRVKEILGVPPGESCGRDGSLNGRHDRQHTRREKESAGKRGATELIQKYGSVENALEHRRGSFSKQAAIARRCSQQREQVAEMSKSSSPRWGDPHVPVEFGFCRGPSSRARSRTLPVLSSAVVTVNSGFKLIAAGTWESEARRCFGDCERRTPVVMTDYGAVRLRLRSFANT